MRAWLIVIVALAIGLRADTADSCACCDSKSGRTPLGWSEAGGALLIDAFEDGCEPRRRLEIWPVGAKEPSGCIDLTGDPGKKIACADVKVCYGSGCKPKPSSLLATFPKAPVKLDPAKVRVSKRWLDESYAEMRVTVEADRNGWKPLWTGTIQPVGYNENPRLSATVWPNARGDRAVVLLAYKRKGTGDEIVDVHWVELR
jgi:hypothetical protein